MLSSMDSKQLGQELIVSTQSSEDIKRLSKFFEILIQIDQRERKKQCKE